MRLKIEPVTSSRWGDLEKLFGPRGACGGCWCMLYKLTRSEFERRKGDGNRRALKRLIDSGEVPGILGYIGGEPVGWCAVEPREAYPALARSRVLRPVDSQRVWSITCLFVAKSWRRSGVSVALLEGAQRHARRLGARMLEGYAVEPRRDPMPDVFANVGIASAYRQAGFREVARRSPTRPIMRLLLAPSSSPRAALRPRVRCTTRRKHGVAVTPRKGRSRSRTGGRGARPA